MGARLPRGERREQLLRVALDVVRGEGTDALTLVRLAERAGVSRPVVYDHFGTREGLLTALYAAYDEGIGRTIRAALRTGGRSLEDVAAVLAGAYVDGVLDAGPECEDVLAALSGNPRTREVRSRSQEFYIEEFRAALAPYRPLSRDADLALLIGVFSTVDGLARAAASGRVSRDQAVAASTEIIVGALTAPDGARRR
ncbi:TetR/AcrR family transcriptional regulator [Allonocardiopsis opalescens]|uniref:TetR family transcriptional regulator n=1 Tax=Allonocardiopsis opalescens TaxID=1144618 RepID=A0A2T0PXV3_9ACTN|nr:TetR/AcrR family transcriptional regulator [Allonocardiopsis opalescens]PRX96339.1 TetR family transcriptional regulator [Allonocardiopsis opalescens]